MKQEAKLEKLGIYNRIIYLRIRHLYHVYLAHNTHHQMCRDNILVHDKIIK